MVYNSLFDTVQKDRPNIYRYSLTEQRYGGTLDHVLSRLENTLIKFNTVPQESITTSDRLSLLLDTPRIIRAAVDYKIAIPTIPSRNFLVKESIYTALSIYSSNSNSLGIMRDFKEKVSKIGNGYMLRKDLEQQSDRFTWISGNPEFSKKTLDNISKYSESKDILFISVGHGSVAVGMDIYLKYLENVTSDNSTFYVMRFSIEKHKDTTPRLHGSEIDYLISESQGKSIVLFDEDVASGKTMSISKELLQKIFKRNIIPLTNYDKRTRTVRIMTPLLLANDSILDIQSENDFMSDLIP